LSALWTRCVNVSFQITERNNKLFPGIFLDIRNANLTLLIINYYY
jgi:hypothetical protein